MKIGLAGVGRMGVGIAAHLAELGHEVTVWNRTADKLKPLAAQGIKLAKTPAEVAAASEIIITILTDAGAIDAVYDGPQGLLAGDVKGKLYIEMSTVRPETEIALAERVRAKGAALVECPVGGSTGPARQGKLLGLCGAEPPDFARAKPVLDQLCRRVEHCGAVGAGALMKFTINLPLMIYWQALGEALALCRDLKLDPARLMDLISDTSGGANILKVRGAAIAAKMKVAEGKSRGIELPLVEKTIACYEEARKKVTGNEEISLLSNYWATR